MKAILEFSLPEENEEYKMYSNAIKYYCVLSELDSFLRTKVKYASDDEPSLKIDTFQEVREKLWEFLKDESIEL